jgi:hypothetical protein
MSTKCHLSYRISRRLFTVAALMMATGLILAAPPRAEARTPSAQVIASVLTVLKGEAIIRGGDSDADLPCETPGLDGKGLAAVEHRILGDASRILRMAGQRLVFHMVDIRWKPVTSIPRQVVVDLSAGPCELSGADSYGPPSLCNRIEPIARLGGDGASDLADRIRETRLMIHLTFRY